MADVDVIVAQADERLALANLMQLYIHDFSEQWAGTPRGDLEDDGRFGAYPLDPYWRDANHIPLLLRCEGRLAGFALLNDASHTGHPVARNMAEFFIARKYRRGGIGTAAVRAILNRYPGVWEAAVARRNVGALAFWRSAVRGHPGVQDMEEIDVQTSAWNGPVLRFQICAA